MGIKRFCVRLIFMSVMLIAIWLVSVSMVESAKYNAADIDRFTVLGLGRFQINIDAKLDDWKFNDEILFMSKETWEPLGGTWENEKDLSAELKITYDKDNLYFGLRVYDDEYVANAGTPWENDGVQIAIDSSAGKIGAGWPNATTHLYNFSIKDGWQKEAGPFLGDAEIQMVRDEANKQTLFEWRMPTSIFAKRGFELKPGVEIAFAIIVNDSDKNAPGQTGWVGWGNHTIVWGKNPEEMKTLVLSAKTMSITPAGKITSTWGILKYQ